jgi:nitrous oxide reductase accessory protein NosL
MNHCPPDDVTICHIIVMDDMLYIMMQRYISNNFSHGGKSMKMSTATRAIRPLLLSFLFCAILGAITLDVGWTAPAPQEIPADVTCGKCGMFPANYPQWQAQVIFDDNSMTPFDGCKCMFGYMFNMEKFDPAHTREQIAAVWVRDFDSGEWTDGRQAHYVVGSEVMGPMGKELIPFADAAAAQAFQQEHGGDMAEFSDINMATLQPLMGKMDMKEGMKMQEHMEK